MAKVGRPREKFEYEKTINIAVPLSILEKIDVAKKSYENNMTKYINTLIKKDLDKNYNSYKAVNAMLKEIKGE